MRSTCVSRNSNRAFVTLLRCTEFILAFTGNLEGTRFRDITPVLIVHQDHTQLKQLKCPCLAGFVQEVEVNTWLVDAGTLELAQVRSELE